MCLYVDNGSIKNLLRRFNKAGGKLVCYKALKIVGKKLVSPIYLYTWKPGWNKSHAYKEMKPNQIIYKPERDMYVYPVEVYAGIHVFTYKTSDLWKKWIRVPVTCYKQDLISAEPTEAVFRKVHLSRRAYEQAFRTYSVQGAEPD